MVNKTITVHFGKCTTLLVPKNWPMKAWLRDVDQWKAENLAGFCNWPITRCSIQNNRARLIIDHTTNFALSGNIDGPCNNWTCIPMGVDPTTSAWKALRCTQAQLNGFTPQKYSNLCAKPRPLIVFFGRHGKTNLCMYLFPQNKNNTHSRTHAYGFKREI